MKHKACNTLIMVLGWVFVAIIALGLLGLIFTIGIFILGITLDILGLVAIIYLVYYLHVKHAVKNKKAFKK